MYDIEPISGGPNSFFAMDSFMRARTASFDRAASASSFNRYMTGNTERAAGAFMHSGPRFFGFQNSGSVKGLVHARPTMHTNPFLPSTAVWKPWRVSTRMVASFEIAAGAALRATAISPSRSAMRYSSSGAITGYWPTAGCAAGAGVCAWSWSAGGFDWQPKTNTPSAHTAIEAADRGRQVAMDPLLCDGNFRPTRDLARAMSR